MIQQKEHFHGSDLEKIEQIYNIKKEDIISFAANVNPLGISPKLKSTLANQIEAIMTYPDREYTSLRTCIAQYVHGSTKHIIVGNGSTELISLFIQITNPKKTLILGPTYSEYEREVSLGGGSVLYYTLSESTSFSLDIDDFINQITEDINLLVICNPNNPTSSVISKNQMELILTHCSNMNTYVMVDETYVEFAKDVNSISSVSLIDKFNNLIVLRGISKFFAAPGLRLGYALCSNEYLLKEINSKKNPWTINSLAAIAGEIMFTDQEYINATRTLIHAERTKVVNRLSMNPYLKVYPSHGNFVLLKILKDGISSYDMFEAAIRKGFMIRDCSTFHSLNDRFIRFCFMNPEDNDRLMDLIEATLA